MSGQIPVRQSALLRWLSAGGVEAGSVDVGPRTPLDGGVASAVVERVSVNVRTADGDRRRADVVAKCGSPAELLAMEELASMPDTSTFPELVDSGIDDDGIWLVVPYYNGSAQQWDARTPDSVVVDLARLHLRFLGRTADLSDVIPRVDETFCHHALAAFAPPGIRHAREQGADPTYDRALRLLDQWTRDERLRIALDLLPATLVHGDVYGHNILVDPDTGVARLIDWGSARIGPAMLDIADIRGDGSELSAYVSCWHEVAGEPLDRWLAEVGYTWAKSFSAGMFVGAIAERFGAAATSEVLDAAEQALLRLGELLEYRDGKVFGGLGTDHG